MNKDRHYLLDILTSAKLAISYTCGKTEQDFQNDLLLQDGVTRRIEILGEAARRVSEETRMKIPSISWYQIIGMRNILAHKYDDIDLDVVWRVVQLELPKLIATLEELNL
jgi:uncharacterized protein with HEPN domain